MTIEPAAAPECAADLVRFAFDTAFAGSLLDDARAMLATAPRELSESFELALRACHPDRMAA